MAIVSINMDIKRFNKVFKVVRVGKWVVLFTGRHLTQHEKVIGCYLLLTQEERDDLFRYHFSEGLTYEWLRQ